MAFRLGHRSVSAMRREMPAWEYAVWVDLLARDPLFQRGAGEVKA